MRLLYFASGIFYLPDSMPPAIRDIIAWNPVLHGVTLLREGYYRGYESHLLDLRYLLFWAVGSVLCGLVVEKIARKPLRSLAT
jgi:capsular polysaccharide transport system permease protein